MRQGGGRRGPIQGKEGIKFCPLATLNPTSLQLPSLEECFQNGPSHVLVSDKVEVEEGSLSAVEEDALEEGGGGADGVVAGAD